MSHTISLKNTFIGSVIVFMALMLATPAFAAEGGTKSKKTVNLSCMQTAVGVREDAVLAAINTQQAAVKTAFEKRKTALTAAWGKTDKAERKTAIKAAWSTWKKDVKDARATSMKARKAAWETFKTTAKTSCKEDVSKDETMATDNTI